MTDRFPLRVAFALLALNGPAAAWTLEFAGEASETAARVERLTSYRMPVGPFAGGDVETRLIEGALDQRAWRVKAPGLSTLEMLQPLRDQLVKGGFEVIYDCEAAACGGFDFRYGTDVLPEPEMHVDLGDFRYLAAMRSAAAGPEYISLIVSRAVDQGFVQVTRIGRTPPPVPQPATADPQPGASGGGPPNPGRPVAVAGVAVPTSRTQAEAGELPTSLPGNLAGSLPRPGGGPLAERFALGGAQVLPDLVFASGSAELADETFASLTELGAFLTGNPGARVILVGHTDASGALSANIALSRERARSVRKRLMTDFDIPARQIEAEGVGYLSPLAPNDTEAGRLANRRVEVMLLAMETE